MGMQSIGGHRQRFAERWRGAGGPWHGTGRHGGAVDGWGAATEGWALATAEGG